MSFLFLVSGRKWDRITPSCGKFMFIHLYGYFSSRLADVEFVAYLTCDLADNNFTVVHHGFPSGFEMSALIVLMSLWATVMPCGSSHFAVIGDIF